MPWFDPTEDVEKTRTPIRSNVDHFVFVVRSTGFEISEGDFEMTADAGQNESRTLAGGEIVHLVKDPGAKWKIRFYECRHHVRIAQSEGLVFEYLEGLPLDWKNREFESADDAAGFVKDEINQGRVPRNSLQPIPGD
jgi:hypothetical protein